MPWKETCVMQEKLKFVLEWQSGDYGMAELCRRHGIERQTGYKWVARYRAEGFEGLKDRSRAPKSNPRAISELLLREVLEVRRAHHTWGARKILAWLGRHRPQLELCAESTVNEHLKRLGLIVPAKKRRRATASASMLDYDLTPNHTWCADFKGWFNCADGSKCVPLTITDASTRFIIKLQSLGGRTDSRVVIPLFDAAFEEFGLPQRVRTDNGPPFASVGLGGLTELSVHLIELGITPERIRPGNPQDNGRHERMHKTLKAETARPPKATLALQQQAFNHWREEFNYERPHEALGQRTPGDLYSCSPRALPEFKKAWTYGDEVSDTRRVRPSGQMKWLGRDVQVSQSLAGRDIGLIKLSEQYWEIYYRHIFLGLFDAKQLLIIRPGKAMERILKKLTVDGGNCGSGDSLRSSLRLRSPHQP